MSTTKATESIAVAGCNCLSCQDAAAKGVGPTTPRNEVEAVIHMMRPLTRTSRSMMVATIQGDKVLAVRVEPLLSSGGAP